MISQEHKQGYRNPWVIGIWALILVVLAVNITFIVFSAGDERSTLVDRDYKTRDRKGADEVLKELHQLRSLNWRVSMDKTEQPRVNQPLAYKIQVHDAEGKPVSGKLEVEVYRGADASKDFIVPFTEVAPGEYQGTITYPLKGYWELHVRVSRGEDMFRAETNAIKVADGV